ncbi:uncharacterized protein APUU_70547A [Aspergillus puulaauensis]|uniref:Amine oxidase domain-containing protein n=1 Tax=Aspergillus puulaauensis TaxID=1220207 RepID=A0A7R8ASB3_9EURO|nr:uncharacterized protein APUU_70547A [Aspergillus puulaauensis]BCS28977.1 hypothetical protein APUU_70547A [Aspergillus puulaauensis]
MGPKMQNMESLSQIQTQSQTQIQTQTRIQSQSPPRRETVAVIGSGMAGLVTAHLLVCDNKKEKDEKDERRRFDVEVLEMQEKLSLDSASYTLPPSSSSASMNGRENEEKDGQRIDLPMRAFAAGYYDNLRKMYEYLGVRFAEPKFVYSLSTLSGGDGDDDSISTSSLCKEKTKYEEEEEKEKKDNGDGIYFIHSSNNHILPPIRPSGVGAAEWVFETAYLVFWYLWFTAACFLVVPKVASSSRPGLKKSTTGETLGAYLTRVRIPTYYTWRYLLPLISSITTCTHHELLNFPASDIVGYARQTYRKPHYTVTGGVQAAEAKLSSGLSVKFNTRVTNVESIEGGEKVRVSWIAQGKAGSKVYDRAIIAVTPDVVGKIFAPLRDAMSVIPTTTVQTVVHRDFSRVERYSAYLRDNSRLQKRKFKSVLDSSSSAGSAGDLTRPLPLTAMHMVTDVASSRTESIHEHPAQVLVTTYALEGGIDESKILHRVDFTRVLRTAQSQAVVNSMFDSATTPAVLSSVDEKQDKAWKSGDGNVFIVGGWCWDGMVLLEGCIVSAMRAADALGVDVPWTR